jgi:hypothetical protein
MVSITVLLCTYVVRMPSLGPYSKAATLAKLDRRSKPARLMASLRRELIAHVGGKPSITQTLLINQACQLQLRLALMDAESDKVGTLTERRQVQYLAWSGSLTRVLDQIGLTAAPPQKDSRPIWERMPAYADEDTL